MAISLTQRVMDMLTQHPGVNRLKLEEIMRSPRARGRRLSQVLIEEGVVGQQTLLEILSRGLGFPAINLARYQVDPALAEVVPEKIARQYHLVPISKLGNVLSVAMSDPLNVVALDDLLLSTNFEITPLIAAEKDVEEAIHKLYQSGPTAAQTVSAAAGSAAESAEAEALEEQQEVIDLTPFGMAGQKAQIVKVVDLMITDALKARASDIHVEPYEQELRVRYRIDGALVEAFRLPAKHRNALITRLKIMSKMDITENRLPQDGRFKVRTENREVDFRVSMLPISFGNKVVMRVLDKSNLSMGLKQLGFLPESNAAFLKAVSRPYGMILMTGPTGSGKSTTLYSCLAEMNDPGKNILTVEDPVEYQVDGITQVQVNSEIGLTFAGALRAFLRQAPDIVLVGEIRDAETADIAIKASLTGQIVLSTLHTNDAPTAVTRLTDMGVDPFLLASSLIFVAAQRLCRQVCARCKVAYQPEPSVLKQLGEPLPKGKALYRGKGCPFCRNTGFRGRFAILEAMLLDDPIREMIITRRSPDEIKAYCVAHGMRTLRQEGLEHCWAERTTLEEVLRVTSEV
ncbi:MAG: Flp pilus assembly complex ATPase component TadA [Candidatus Omnitrophica bacterium]|nr:Flp pilus assembly complex ATPase component TadA [Candidatus Omnitrophota bacterium]